MRLNALRLLDSSLGDDTREIPLLTGGDPTAVTTIMTEDAGVSESLSCLGQLSIPHLFKEHTGLAVSNIEERQL